MKRIALYVLLLAAWAPMAALARQSTQALAVGGRLMSTHAAFPESPFDDGDVSYGLAYEYHDVSGYWQLACYYAPSVGPRTNRADYVITPALNLLFTDKMWHGGAGVLRSSVTKDGDTDWTDFYWQFILGVDIPLFGVQLSANTYYVFQNWSELNEFRFGDLEYGVWATWFF